MNATLFNGLRLTALFSAIAWTTGCYNEVTTNVSFSSSDTSRSYRSDLPRSFEAASPASRPGDFEVTPADLAAREATLNATAAAIAKTEREISNIEAAFAVAQNKLTTIPQELAELRTLTARQSREIGAVEVQVVEAERAYSEFHSDIERRKSDAINHIAAQAKEGYEQSISQIELARQNRNELRASRRTLRQAIRSTSSVDPHSTG